MKERQTQWTQGLGDWGTGSKRQGHSRHRREQEGILGMVDHPIWLECGVFE